MSSPNASRRTAASATLAKSAYMWSYRSTAADTGGSPALEWDRALGSPHQAGFGSPASHSTVRMNPSRRADGRSALGVGRRSLATFGHHAPIVLHQPDRIVRVREIHAAAD